MNKLTKTIARLLMLPFFLVTLASCGNNAQVSDDAVKTFTLGTTAYGVAMENAGLDPHQKYMGWSAVRYGVGETLFRLDDTMQLTPWLAESYEMLDEHTIKIVLREDVQFANGSPMTGESVKACFERLIATHDRAPNDLKLTQLSAESQTITLTSSDKASVLIYYLCDPYAAIIDVEVGVDAMSNVVGTGPYIATTVSDTKIELANNPIYWGETPKISNITILSIPDGDTLTMAMQAGEIDAAQGLPYASLGFFQDSDDFIVDAVDTSRVYQIAFNFKSEPLQDVNIRKAICMAIDKKSFTSILLDGNGSPATGAFPASFSIGNDTLEDLSYDPAQARALLEAAGFADSDGDGYLERDGIALSLTLLTYTSRQELPLLAEFAQAQLADIGIRLTVKATDSYLSDLESGNFDLFASAFVAAPTGDAQYYFTTHLLTNASNNYGHYENVSVQEHIQAMRGEFDAQARAALSIEIQQLVLDDAAFFYVSHLRMSLVMQRSVSGFVAHPTDFYEITSSLEMVS